MQQAFTSAALASYVEQMNPRIAEGIHDWHERGPGFLAFPAFVYALGTAELAAAALLLAGFALRWVGLLCAGLFTGTLAIFVIAPAVSYGEAGFPRLTLAGEFLLKDLVLFAASLAVVALAAERRAAGVGR